MEFGVTEYHLYASSTRKTWTANTTGLVVLATILLVPKDTVWFQFHQTSTASYLRSSFEIKAPFHLPLMI